MHTSAVEDYLKAVYEVGRTDPTVTTSALAERLDVSPASVTGMVKKLAEAKLVTHEPYRGVALTAAGRRIAIEVIRHHRLVETYLHEALGVKEDDIVHQHAASDLCLEVVAEAVLVHVDGPVLDADQSVVPLLRQKHFDKVGDDDKFQLFLCRFDGQNHRWFKTYRG